MFDPKTYKFISLEEIKAAGKRLRGVAVRTPLVRLQVAGAAGEVFVKNEGAQATGSFKLRGAYNKISQLTAEERGRGVIAYSSGNHAQGVAYAARALGVKAVIVMPGNAPEVKRQATEALGAEIVTVGPSSLERKAKAEALAAEFGYVVIPPYDDAQIIAGQGTVGLEIVEDLPDVDLVLTPVSGGGLLSGVAAAVKGMKPETRVIGVEPELAGDAQESFRAGEIVTWPAELTTRTICDGLRTQSVGELNFTHIRVLVDNIITVTDDEVRRAVQVLDAAGIKAEPSGAVTTAALLFHDVELRPYMKVAAVVSGSNAD
ncbi:MAG TPA: threonine/serine dehydratase [Acidobacteriaceae bacterium]|jgi:threonine dehydratase|nr:threonine/serine dehydratase [Acidobacteriaceae bacterium]